MSKVMNLNSDMSKVINAKTDKCRTLQIKSDKYYIMCSWMGRAFLNVKLAIEIRCNVAIYITLADLSKQGN